MEYLTRKNIGLVISILLGLFLCLGAFGKFFGSAEGFAEMGSTHIADWMKIIGVGEFISIILFILPKTHKLGTVLLSAFFGGAIMFHMAHSAPEHQSIVASSVFLVLIWLVSWIRGNELVDLK